MTSSDFSEETESFPSEEEQGPSSITEEITDDELPVLEEKPESSSLEVSEVQEESPPYPDKTTGGDIPRSASSSSLEFPSQPSVRQSMLLTRKEAMVQQARR